METQITIFFKPEYFRKYIYFIFQILYNINHSVVSIFFTLQFLYLSLHSLDKLSSFLINSCSNLCYNLKKLIKENTLFVLDNINNKTTFL